MTHQIAKLPIRVYTPIPDLRYNETVEEDIIEMDKILNIDVSALRSLSPVTCQTHEPHDSLRSVPWVRTPGVIGTPPDEEYVEPGIMLYRNGVWKNAVPSFEALATAEDDIQALITNVINPNNVNVAASLLAAETARDNTETLMNTSITNAGLVYKNMIRTRQFASHDCVLYGQETVAIPAGTGIYAPGTIEPHITVNFVTRGEQGYDTENPTVPWGSPVYRTYCHPMALMGGGYDEQSWNKPHPSFILDKLSYRSRWSKWEYLRLYWEKMLLKVDLSRPEYRRWRIPLATTYTPFRLEDNGWVLFAREFGFNAVTPPTILINITEDTLSGTESWLPTPLDEDIRSPSEPEVWCENPVLSLASGEYYTSFVTVSATCATPGSEIRYTLNHTVPTFDSPLLPAGGVNVDVPGRIRVKAFDTADNFAPSSPVTGQYTPFNPESNWIRPYVWLWIDPDDPTTVLGFKVWFTNYSYNPSGVSQRDRTVKFTWSAYGKRKAPPHIWTEA